MARSVKSKTESSTPTTNESTNGTIQAVDLPLGVAARTVESVREIATDRRLSERRGAELRREAVQRVQPLRDRVGQEVDRVRERISALR
jgi:hypothetical protein